MAYGQFGTNSSARKKRVLYEGTDTIYEGMPLCYNQDSTTNILGWDKGNGVKGTTTAEGYQNEGKFMQVEKPATANLDYFAGVVAGESEAGMTGPRWLDIYVNDGAIVPVRTDANCVLGQTLGVADGSYVLSAVTGDGDPAVCATMMETVDRSSTNGLVLAKLYKTGQGIHAKNSFFTPVRYGVTGYAFGVRVSGDAMFRGTAASKSYIMQIDADRESDYVATGDSNDALLKMAGNNYAANDANFILRGINSGINNRSGGVMGRLEGASIGAQNKSGGTVTTLIGLTVVAENYGTLTGTDVFGGIDVLLKNEAAVGATEFGIRIRNENNSIADAVGAAIKITDTGANTGFDYLLDAYGATAPTVALMRFGQTTGEDIVIAMGDFTDAADSGFAPGSLGMDTTNGLLFVSDSAGLWQQVTV